MLADVLSQFYRAFPAVLSPVLKQEVGMSAAGLSLASAAVAVYLSVQDRRD